MGGMVCHHTPVVILHKLVVLQVLQCKAIIPVNDHVCELQEKLFSTPIIFIIWWEHATMY